MERYNKEHCQKMLSTIARHREEFKKLSNQIGRTSIDFSQGLLGLELTERVYRLELAVAELQEAFK